MFFADHFSVENGKIKHVDWFIDKQRNVVVFELEVDESEDPR